MHLRKLSNLYIGIPPPINMDELIISISTDEYVLEFYEIIPEE